MLRATMMGPGKILFEDVPVPVIHDDQVLVRIRRIGICGSDIHVFHGKHPYVSYPVVQGHEFSGEVVAVGKGVRRFKPGDLVTSPPQIVCRQCDTCRRGEYHICEHLRVIGFQAPGTAQELFAFAEHSLLNLPADFSVDLGAMVEPVSVAVHAVKRAGPVRGLRILVLGAGPIGNLVAQNCRSQGAEEIAITDLSDHRLAIANQCGIANTINPRTENLASRLWSFFGKANADLVFECVGLGETLNHAIQFARKGATIVIVGVFGDRPVVDIGIVQDHELRVVGSLMYQMEDFVDAIRFMAEGQIVTKPLLSRSFPFRQYLDAYHFIDENHQRVMKVLIDLDTRGD